MTSPLMIGIDEVGRGPWAGPLVASAVLASEEELAGIASDSKRLSSRQRHRALAGIRSRALAIGIGWVSAADIDRYGLTQATTRAMHTALEYVHNLVSLSAPIVVDGNYNYLPASYGARTQPHGDATCSSIAAASIVAKTLRDGFMEQMKHVFPGYGFEYHVGYGTAGHREALHRYGTCTLHRHSFAPIKRVSSK